MSCFVNICRTPFHGTCESPPSPPPGYVVSVLTFLIMVLFILLSVFNFLWLSHWLEQGSGVSVVMGVGHMSVRLCGVGQESLRGGLGTLTASPEPATAKMTDGAPGGPPGARIPGASSLLGWISCAHRMSAYPCGLVGQN